MPDTAGAVTHTIRFTKTGRSFGCPEGISVLEAAQGAGLENLAFSCQGGTCRTCAVKGAGEMETDQMLALTPPELRDGLRLTCVAFPRGDCDFEL